MAKRKLVINTKTNNPAKLKPILVIIIILLYRFRFLNRQQIQTLLKRKHKQQVILWLNELTSKKYIKRYYFLKFAGEPAVYSLGNNGRKYFLEHPDIKDINKELLDRVWKKYSPKFHKHCIFVAHIYLSLIEFLKNAQIDFFTKHDLKGVRYILLPEPDAYFAIKQNDGNIKRYFLEVIDPYTSWKKVKRRIREYFSYFEKELWQNNMKHPFPEIIIVCPHPEHKAYVKSFIKKMLGEKEDNILFYLSTWDEIKQQGINRNVLHKVEI